MYGYYDVPVYFNVPGPPDWSVDGAGLPALVNTLVDNHDAWQGYMRKQELAALSPDVHGVYSRLAVGVDVPGTAGTNAGLEDFLFASDFDPSVGADVAAWILSLPSIAETPSKKHDAPFGPDPRTAAAMVAGAAGVARRGTAALAAARLLADGLATR